MAKNVLIIIISLIFCITCTQQTQKKTKYIRLKGSDTMYTMVVRWAEEYMKQNRDISIYAEGGGSAHGFQHLIEGEVDICASSRPMLPYEVRQLAEKHQRLGISHIVAKDALSIYLHPANPVTDLSQKQLKDIFSGRIENWKKVGGKDMPIRVLTRSPNSGTYLYFKEHVLDDENYTNDADIYYSTQALIDEIAENENAIAYGGTAYGDRVLHCRIDGVEPTIENVIQDKYPIARYLYLYTIDTPRGHIKDFIDWILDMPGQVIVAQVGYIPLFRTDSLQNPSDLK